MVASVDRMIAEWTRADPIAAMAIAKRAGTRAERVPEGHLRT